MVENTRGYNLEFPNLQNLTYMARKNPRWTSCHDILCLGHRPQDIWFTMTSMTWGCFRGHPLGCLQRRPRSAMMSTVVNCNVPWYITIIIYCATVNAHIADVLEDIAEARKSRSETSQTASHETATRLPKHCSLVTLQNMRDTSEHVAADVYINIHWDIVGDMRYNVLPRMF